MKEIKALTSLRGIAALAVVLQHFSATAQKHCDVTIPSLAPHGYMAVDFFFVLSGFIMSYTYLKAFQADPRTAFPEFLARRVARVVPLNVAVLLLLMLAAAVSVALLGRNIFFRSDNIPFDLIANLFMLQGLGIGRNLNGPSWSISTEFAAYLAFPLFVALVFHSRRIVFFTAVLVAVAGVVLIALQLPRFGLNTETIGASLARCFTEFVLGLAAYRLYRLPGPSQWLGQDRVTFALTAAAVILLVAGIDLPVVLLFPFLIVAFASNNGLAGRLLSTRLLYFLGVISYSIYLIHDPFRPLSLEIIRALHPASLSYFGALGFAFFSSLLIIPFAWLSFIAFERPGRDVVRRLFARSPTKAPRMD